MKLTEKELNEFPIGTKLYTNYGKKYMKLDNSSAEWREMKDSYWINSDSLLDLSIKQVEIPTYTEYIPPKPILDDKEKEYLSAVIRPWRKKVIHIKKSGTEKSEYLSINIREPFGVMLPYFKAGTMYKGMELDREYSLEELDI